MPIKEAWQQPIQLLLHSMVQTTDAVGDKVSKFLY